VRLRELQEILGRLEDFAAQSQAENTIRAYAADLEDFRHWCKKYDQEWLPAQPKTIGLYLGVRADELSLANLERRLASIASLHKEEGYESPADVAEGPLRKIWKGIVREKTRQQDGLPFWPKTSGQLLNTSPATRAPRTALLGASRLPLYAIMPSSCSAETGRYAEVSLWP